MEWWAFSDCSSKISHQYLMWWREMKSCGEEWGLGHLWDRSCHAWCIVLKSGGSFLPTWALQLHILLIASDWSSPPPPTSCRIMIVHILAEILQVIGFFHIVSKPLCIRNSRLHFLSLRLMTGHQWPQTCVCYITDYPGWGWNFPISVISLYFSPLGRS